MSEPTNSEIFIFLKNALRSINLSLAFGMIFLFIGILVLALLFYLLNKSGEKSPEIPIIKKKFKQMMKVRNRVLKKNLTPFERKQHKLRRKQKTDSESKQPVIIFLKYSLLYVFLRSGNSVTEYRKYALPEGLAQEKQQRSRIVQTNYEI